MHSVVPGFAEREPGNGQAFLSKLLCPVLFKSPSEAWGFGFRKGSLCQPLAGTEVAGGFAWVKRCRLCLCPQRFFGWCFKGQGAAVVVAGSHCQPAPVRVLEAPALPVPRVPAGCPLLHLLAGDCAADAGVAVVAGEHR